MELKELTSAEQVVMKCIWDYGKDMPLQQLIENLKQDYGKDYKSIFKRSKNGTYTIADEYFMPTVRDVPIFSRIS